MEEVEKEVEVLISAFRDTLRSSTGGEGPGLKLLSSRVEKVFDRGFLRI